jgi:hypothetical protein
MFCPQCGNARGARDRFCPVCGMRLGHSSAIRDAPARRRSSGMWPRPGENQRWEMAEIVIPLYLDTGDVRCQERFQELLDNELTRLATERWSPAEPIGWGALWSSGAIRRRRRRDLRGEHVIAESVTIRVRRAVAVES